MHMSEIFKIFIALRAHWLGCFIINSLSILIATGFWLIYPKDLVVEKTYFLEYLYPPTTFVSCGTTLQLCQRDVLSFQLAQIIKAENFQRERDRNTYYLGGDNYSIKIDFISDTLTISFTEKVRTMIPEEEKSVILVELNKAHDNLIDKLRLIGEKYELRAEGLIERIKDLNNNQDISLGKELTVKVGDSEAPLLIYAQTWLDVFGDRKLFPDASRDKQFIDPQKSLIGILLILILGFSASVVFSLLPRDAEKSK